MTRVAVTVPREEILFGADVEVQLAASLPKVSICELGENIYHFEKDQNVVDDDLQGSDNDNNKSDEDVKDNKIDS